MNKVTEIIYTFTYDFNSEGGAVSTFNLPVFPRTSIGGSNMFLIPQLCTIVIGGSLGGDVTTTLDLQFGGVSIFSFTNPNLLVAGSVLINPPEVLIPNVSNLTMTIGVLPITQGDFTGIFTCFVLYV